MNKFSIFFYFLIFITSCTNHSNNNNFRETIATQEETEAPPQEEATAQEELEKTKFKTDYTSLNFDIISNGLIIPGCDNDDGYCPHYSYDYIQILENGFDLINSDITREILEENTSFETAANAFFKEYYELLEINPEEVDYESEPWDLSISTVVYFNRKNILSIEFEYYSWMGGAHPDRQYKTATYDLQTQKRVKFYDLVNAKDSIALKALGELYFRKEMDIEENIPLEESGFFDELFTGREQRGFQFNDSFFLTEDGLSFIYSNYEITSYSGGIQEFTIPYEELKPYLTPNSLIKRLL